MKNAFDIILCGGGHVGSCLALGLAQQNINLALIDKFIDNERKKPEDNRIFALSSSSQKILIQLGVWPYLAEKATPIKHIHISNKGSFGAARLNAHDFQEENFGYMVSSFDLQKGLNQAIKATSLTHFSPATLENIEIDQTKVSATLKQRLDQENAINTLITAEWIIGADGVNSFVREKANISLSKKKYQQKALVALIDLENSHQFTAYERFVEDSAIALLPYTPWQSVLIWSGKEDFIDELMSFDEKTRLIRLQKDFGYRLGRFSSMSQCMSYSLSRTQAHAIHSQRLLLIGNAAQTLHPIGAQGFNLALAQVALLLSLLREAKENEQNIFSQNLLNTYAERQEIYRSKMMGFTEQLVRFSSHKNSLSNIVRSLLINTLGASKLAQQSIIRQ